MRPVAVLGSGMVTGVGLDAPSSCAALRCAIDNFRETRFMDKGGEWITGSEVPLNQSRRGIPRLVGMIVPAIRQCLEGLGARNAREIPLLLCAAERKRPGRFENLEHNLFHEVQRELGSYFHPSSSIIPQGKVAGAVALAIGSKLIHQDGVPLCLIAGVDSFLVRETLAVYEQEDRLLTSKNSNGFIPGEAAAAVIIGLPGTGLPLELLCVGLGTGSERATIGSDEPLRGVGLAQAIQAALASGGLTTDDVHYRITDLSGEQYGFKEAALAESRLMRKPKRTFELWHPADCIGEVGAAIGPCVLGVAHAAAIKEYAPGPGVLCHFSGDDSTRIAVIMSYQKPVAH